MDILKITFFEYSYRNQPCIIAYFNRCVAVIYYYDEETGGLVGQPAFTKGAFSLGDFIRNYQMGYRENYEFNPASNY